MHSYAGAAAANCLCDHAIMADASDARPSAGSREQPLRSSRHLRLPPPAAGAPLASPRPAPLPSPSRARALPGPLAALAARGDGGGGATRACVSALQLGSSRLRSCELARLRDCNRAQDAAVSCCRHVLLALNAPR
jgi:hypothetical protein